MWDRLAVYLDDVSLAVELFPTLLLLFALKDLPLSSVDVLISRSRVTSFLCWVLPSLGRKEDTARPLLSKIFIR